MLTTRKETSDRYSATYVSLHTYRTDPNVFGGPLIRLEGEMQTAQLSIALNSCETTIRSRKFEADQSGSERKNDYVKVNLWLTWPPG